MVQVIQGFNPEAEYATQRQQALNQGLQGIIGGLQGLQQQAQTQRQQALQGQQIAADLRKQGYDVNPDMVNQALAPEPSAIAKLFGAKSPESPDLYANRTQEYKDKMAMAASDRADKKKQQEFQNQLALMKFAQEKNIKFAEISSKNKEGKSSQGGDEGGLPKLNAEEKNKIGSIASGFQAIDTMKKSLESGQGPTYVNANTPIIGAAISDTPYTAAERNLSEVIGRLQSGGAINEDEGKRFLAMGPRPGDSKEIQNKKIMAQQNFLENKLSAYGIKPNDLSKSGFNISDAYNIQGSANQAVAAPSIHPQTNKALEWAQKNPNDPRAQQIMQRIK